MIETGEIIPGHPRRAERLVVGWLALHRAEPIENGILAAARQASLAMTSGRRSDPSSSNGYDASLAVTRSAAAAAEGVEYRRM